MKQSMNQKLDYSEKEDSSNFVVEYLIINIFFWLVIFLFFGFAQTISIEAQTLSESVYYKQGLNYLNQQNFSAAARSFQLALQSAPDDDLARRGLAIALVGAEKFPEASREIAKSLALAPKDGKLLELAAQCFWQQKRFAETEIVLQRRLKLGDERAELWSLYGDALDVQKKTIQAVTAYENAVRLAPNSITLRYALGAFYWKLIRYDDAEREFLKILSVQPNEPRASFNLGDIYLTQGDAAKSLPFLETAAKAFPDEFDTRFALGRALLATNKPEAALVELQAAVKLKPDIAEGHFHLGRALQRAGRRTEAKSEMQKAQSLQNAQRSKEQIKLPAKSQ
ncbi:MAG: tetratricopeptide repeat protein [Acidobacteriota bacterium]|nr:tetratricopeptide repeat protein [Acidobacteriota bacterium]